MLSCVSIEEFIDFTLKIVECSMLLMKKKSQITGKPVDQHVFIFDLDGFSLKVFYQELTQYSYYSIKDSNSWSNYGDIAEVDWSLSRWGDIELSSFLFLFSSYPNIYWFLVFV